MKVSNVTAMISLAFALLGAAAVYGTDVFFCVVGRTALTRVSDAALVETMGRFHEERTADCQFSASSASSAHSRASPSRGSRGLGR